MYFSKRKKTPLLGSIIVPQDFLCVPKIKICTQSLENQHPSAYLIVFYHEKAHLSINLSLIFLPMCFSFLYKKKKVLTVSNHYFGLGENPWASSSSLNHKVPFWLPLNLFTHSAHVCYSFSERIKKTQCRCFTMGGGKEKKEMEKHIYSRTNDGISEENEWRGSLRVASL